MSPEFGSTCAFFGVDDETLNYLHLTGRQPESIAEVREYSKQVGLWYDHDQTRTYSDTNS